jgi:hypothetical protein
LKKITALIIILTLSLFNTGLLSQAYAQTEAIESVEAAKELASNAGGIYVDGEAAPALTGDQIALPVIDETTGNILGHIVAEKANLVSALNAAGHTGVATAISAAEVGTATAGAVGAGFLGGTTGAIVAGVAVIVGVALAVSGGGGSGSSSNH